MCNGVSLVQALVSRCLSVTVIQIDQNRIGKLRQKVFGVVWYGSKFRQLAF